jgi:hypothetical protein
LIYTPPEKLPFLEDAKARRAALDAGRPRPTASEAGGRAAGEPTAPGTATGSAIAGRTSSMGMPTLLSMAGRATGPVNVTSTFLERYGVGFFGDLKPGAMQADAFVSNAVNRINRSIATNPRFAEGERTSIKAELDLLPAFLRDEVAFGNRLVGIDLLLERLERDSLRASTDTNITVDERNLAANDYRIINNTRDLMGIKPLPLLLDPNDERSRNIFFNELRAGDYYKRINPSTGSIVLRRKARD